jgi:hypothetical protein
LEQSVFGLKGRFCQPRPQVRSETTDRRPGMAAIVAADLKGRFVVS